MSGESQQKEVQILLVPGMLGSRLRKDGRQLWPAFLQSALGQLRLGPCGPDGKLEPGEVVPDSILDRMGFADLYRSLIDRFNSAWLSSAHFHGPRQRRVRRALAWGDSAGLQGQAGVKTYSDTFPYDWRLPIDVNSRLLGQKIAAVPAERAVVVIAHSLGGLVTRHCLLTNPQAAERVQFLFSLGTPWLGVPEAYVSLQEGLGMQYLLFASMESQRALAQSLPSVYQLLPSRSYFTYPGPDYYLMEYGSGAALDFSKSSSQVDEFGYGRYYSRYNTGALQQMLSQPLTNSRGPIPHFAVGGTGRLTLESLQIHHDGTIAWRMESRSGDGTVPHKSVAPPDGDAVIRYVDAGHLSLPAAKPVRDWVEWVLTGKDGAHPEIEGLLETPLEADGEAVFIHSPVDLLITSRDGYLHAGVLSQYVINHAPDVTVSMGQDQTRRVTLPVDGRGYVITCRSTAGTADSNTTSLILRHVSYRGGKAVGYAVFWGVDLKGDEAAELIMADGRAMLLIAAADGAQRKLHPDYGGAALYQSHVPPKLTATAAGHAVTNGRSPLWLKREEPNELRLEATDGLGPVRVEIWERGCWTPYREPLRVPACQLLTVRARALNASGNVTEREFTVGWASRRPSVTLRVQGKRGGKGLYVGAVSLSFAFRVKDPVRPAFVQVKVDDQPEQVLPPGERLSLSPCGGDAYRSYRLTYFPVDIAGNAGESRTVLLALMAETTDTAARADAPASVVTGTGEGDPAERATLVQAISIQTGGVTMRHEFGARLRQLRKERLLLQRDLERALNLRPGGASQYERGLREPGFDLLLTIADFFGVSVDYLLGRPGAARQTAMKSDSL